MLRNDVNSDTQILLAGFTKIFSAAKLKTNLNKQLSSSFVSQVKLITEYDAESMNNFIYNLFLEKSKDIHDDIYKFFKNLFQLQILENFFPKCNSIFLNEDKQSQFKSVLKFIIHQIQHDEFRKVQALRSFYDQVAAILGNKGKLLVESNLAKVTYNNFESKYESKDESKNIVSSTQKVNTLLSNNQANINFVAERSPEYLPTQPAEQNSKLAIQLEFNPFYYAALPTPTFQPINYLPYVGQQSQQLLTQNFCNFYSNKQQHNHQHHNHKRNDLPSPYSFGK